MRYRWMQRAAWIAVLCGMASGAAVAGDTTIGIVADPCASEKTPEQVGSTWQAYLFARDFGQLCHYRAPNLTMAADASPKVVFMGDSITELWTMLDPAFFANGTVGRGISGQTTTQMLVRFRQDVIDLHPAVVHIMAGTNDVAGNTGPATLAQVEGNIASMAELAQSHGIRVILASVPPAANFPWRKEIQPVATIQSLNAWIKDYAARHGLVYVDYFHAMATAQGGMKDGLSGDGVHPTRAGYDVMEPLAAAAIRQALQAPAAQAAEH